MPQQLTAHAVVYAGTYAFGNNHLLIKCSREIICDSIRVCLYTTVSVLSVRLMTVLKLASIIKSVVAIM